MDPKSLEAPPGFKPGIEVLQTSAVPLGDRADDEASAVASLQRFAIHGLHLTQARRCALLQRRSSRRLGENDAWLIATADSLNADVAGADRGAFERLGSRYLRFR